MYCFILIKFCIFCFFFFSSRRRHTRCSRDWSSDVCSSDVDTPVEISADCSVDEFREAGKTFRVAIHSFGERDAEPATLVDGLRKIVRSEMAMMPSPDFEHYAFIVHFAPDVPLADGMEHFNSTDIVIRGSLADGLVEALETAAHEFFHLWNVKRLN